MKAYCHTAFLLVQPSRYNASQVFRTSFSPVEDYALISTLHGFRHHDECNEELTVSVGAVSVSHCRYKSPTAFGEHFPQLAGLVQLTVHLTHPLDVWNVQLCLPPLQTHLR